MSQAEAPRQSKLDILNLPQMAFDTGLLDPPEPAVATEDADPVVLPEVDLLPELRALNPELAAEQQKKERLKRSRNS